MARIVYTPPKSPRAPRMRSLVEFRFACLYPEGTIIEDRHGVRWRSWRPGSYAEMDMAPAWKEITDGQVA